jgi:hypothetical protein
LKVNSLAIASLNFPDTSRWCSDSITNSGIGRRGFKSRVMWLCNSIALGINSHLAELVGSKANSGRLQFVNPFFNTIFLLILLHTKFLLEDK